MPTEAEHLAATRAICGPHCIHPKCICGEPPTLATAALAAAEKVQLLEAAEAAAARHAADTRTDDEKLEGMLDFVMHGHPRDAHELSRNRAFRDGFIAGRDAAALVADQWEQPGTPGDPCWLAIGNELGKVADAIRALGKQT